MALQTFGKGLGKLIMAESKSFIFLPYDFRRVLHMLQVAVKVPRTHIENPHRSKDELQIEVGNI